MSKSSCSYSKSKNANKQWFINNGIIDQYNNIIEGQLAKFREQNTRWSKFAIEKFGLEIPEGMSDRLYLEEANGRVARPNIVMFKMIDETKSRVSKEPVESVQPKLTPDVYTQLEITFTDEEGNPCAKMGARSSKFTKGSKWEMVKDLKGYPSHAQGGVDIKLGDGGFSFARGTSQVMAAFGLVLPAIKAEDGLVMKSEEPEQQLQEETKLPEQSKERTFDRSDFVITFVDLQDMVDLESPMRFKTEQNKLIKRFNKILNNEQAG